MIVNYVCYSMRNITITMEETCGSEHNSIDCPNFVDPKDGVNDCCGRCKGARSDHTTQYDPEKNEQDNIKKREPDDSKMSQLDGVEKRKQDDNERDDIDVKKSEQDGVGKRKQGDNEQDDIDVKKSEQDGVGKRKQDGTDEQHDGKNSEVDDSKKYQQHTGTLVCLHRK